MSYSMQGGSIDAAINASAVDERFYPLGDDLKKTITVDRDAYVAVMPDQSGSISLGATNEITFTRKATSSCGLDLAGTYWTLQCRLRRGNTNDADTPTVGLTMEDKTILGVVPAYVHALWDEIRVTINGVDVGDSLGGGLYPHLAHSLLCLESPNSLTEFDTPSSDWDGMILPSAYEPQGTTGEADVAAVADASWEVPRASLAASHRRRRFVDAGTDGYVTLLLKPKIAALNIPDFLPPGTELTVTFRKARNRSQPCVGDGTAAAGDAHSGTAPFIQFKDGGMVMMCRQVFGTEAAMESFKLLRVDRPLRYNIPRARCVAQTIATQQFDISGQLAGIIPDVVLIKVVPDGNFAGTAAAVPLSIFDGTTAKSRLTAELPGTAYFRVEAGGVSYPVEGNCDTHAKAYAQYLNVCSKTDGGSFGGKAPMGFQAWVANPLYVVSTRPDGESMRGRATDDLRRGAISIQGRFAVDPSSGTAAPNRVMIIGLSYASFSIALDGSVGLNGY